MTCKIISSGPYKKSCDTHATSPTSDQIGRKPAENTIPLMARLDLSTQIRVSIGLVDVDFITNKSLVSVTI